MDIERRKGCRVTSHYQTAAERRMTMADWIKFFAWIFISGIIGATVSIVCNFLYDAFKKGE